MFSGVFDEPEIIESMTAIEINLGIFKFKHTKKTRHAITKSIPLECLPPFKQEVIRIIRGLGS